jgi:hypothetical protein
MSLLSSRKVSDNIVELLYLLARIPLNHTVQLSSAIHVNQFNTSLLLTGESV